MIEEVFAEENAGYTWHNLTEDVIPEGTTIITGGSRFVDQNNWPHFGNWEEDLEHVRDEDELDVPLVFVATLFETDENGVKHIVNVFTDNSDLESWDYDGANCVMVDGKVNPYVIQLKPVSSLDGLLLSEKEYVSNGSLKEPRWIDREELPDDEDEEGNDVEYRFLNQIPSLEGLTSIGDTDGTSYVFVDKDWTRGATLHQA